MRAAAIGRPTDGRLRRLPRPRRAAVLVTIESPRPPPSKTHHDTSETALIARAVFVWYSTSN
jgi:hypothetical protein